MSSGNTAQRQRKQAERRERASRRAEIDRAAAIRAEQIAEEQAPRAQRVAVVGLRIDLATGLATQEVIREPLAEPDRKRGGYRRADPLLRLHAANSRTVTALHLRAAQRFALDYETGIEGASPGGGPTERVDGASDSGASDRQLDAIARYRAACDAMGGVLRTPVQLIALHGWTVGRIATLAGLSQHQTTGYIAAGLDRLSEWYWPGRVQRFDEARKAEALVDAAVVDIPQDRLGRWRTSHEAENSSVPATFSAI